LLHQVFDREGAKDFNPEKEEDKLFDQEKKPVSA
jgi:hypothetical protein